MYAYANICTRGWLQIRSEHGAVCIRDCQAFPRHMAALRFFVFSKRWSPSFREGIGIMMLGTNYSPRRYLSYS